MGPTKEHGGRIGSNMLRPLPTLTPKLLTWSQVAEKD